MRQWFREFIDQVQAKEIEVDQIFLDSNILISYFHESSSAYETATRFFENLDEAVRLAGTNSPKFVISERVLDEVLEYEKRKVLSEQLKSLKANRNFRPSKMMISQVAHCLRTCDTRVRREEENVAKGKVEVFEIKKFFLSDDEVRKIKRSISSADTTSEQGWITFCKVYLDSRITKAYNRICNDFIVIENTNDRMRVNKLCESIGMGYSDSIIYQTFVNSQIRYLASFDFDMLYANEVLAQSPCKTVLVPSGYFGESKYIVRSGGDGVEY